MSRMQINAAVVRRPDGPFEIEDVTLDAPRDDEVLVEVAATGICQTDLSVRAQHIPVPMPVVLGHEGAGIVREIGSAVSGLAPGDHVVMSQAFCGTCAMCLAGNVAYCPDAARLSLGGVRADGSHTIHDRTGTAISGCFVGQSSFATYALAAARNVVKVPDDLPLELLGPLGCGVMTGAGTVANTLRPRAGTTLAVFGAGGVGLSAALAGHVAGCAQVIVIDVVASRLSLAADLGATHTLDASDTDAVAAVHELTGGGADFSIEATGVPSVGRQAVDAVHALGTAAIIGAAPYGSELVLDWTSVMAGRTVRGAVMGGSNPTRFIPQMIDWYREGRFPFDRLVKFYDFHDIERAIEDMYDGSVVKPVLRMTAG